MPSALRRRVSLCALLLLTTLTGSALNAVPAAAVGGSSWLVAASDPVALQSALADNGSKLPDEFGERLRYAQDGLLRVIVAVSDRTPALETFVDQNTTWVRWYFDNPRFYAGITPDQLTSLLESEAVTFVEPDVKLSYFLSSSTLDVHARSNGTDGAGVWSYDAASDALRSDVAGLTVDQATGKGVTVAITDSGIDRTHRDFGGWDCTPGPYQPCDSRIVRAVTTEHLFGGPDAGDLLPTTEAASGHGTHVAGIVAGNGYMARDGAADGDTYGGDGIPIGVAPQANLIMTKNGDTIWAGLSQFGLEWQLENAAAHNIRVSSNSWGCVGGCTWNSVSAMGGLLKDMYDAGIVVTFAAGNDGGGSNGAAFSGYAQSPYVLGVASYDDTNKRLASSSSRGSDNSLPAPATWTPGSEPSDGERRPDVAAPGVGIWSARTLTGGAASLAPRQNTGDVTGGAGCCIREYAVMDGTSMATPHVSGAAALAFSACPTAKPLDVMRAIMATAQHDVLKSTGSATAEPFEVGYGGLEVRAAVDWLLARGCDSSQPGGGEPTPTPTATPTPTPTETTPPPPTGGTRYYFHSLSGIGNADALMDGSTFDKAAPTFVDASRFHDIPFVGSAAAEAPWDPFWTGAVDGSISAITLDFWTKTPIGDLLGEVHYAPSIFANGTQYELPVITQAVEPQVGTAPTRITKTFTTMLDANGSEVPLSIDPAGSPVTISISGNFIDAESGSWMVYDSPTYPAGFTIHGGTPDPDPTPTESPTPDPTEPPPPTGRGTYPTNPNDPLFAEQWGMTKIEAPQAWQETNATGYGIKIAVVDSGVDHGHEDFQCPGKIEILPGSDISTDNDPQDEDGHGTHVAGIAGACTNNGKGVVGVAPDSTIMPVRVFGESDLDKAMADGIRFATQNGAHVINLSIGDIPPFSHFGAMLFPETEEAMAEARAAGVVIAAAAGNFDQPTCEYPSMSRNVICVVATDRNDVRSYYSDFPVNADPNADEPKIEPVVAAPGGQGTFCEEGITSTYWRDEAEPVCHERGYESLDGTSMASPHVAGLAALMYDRLGGQRSKANADLIVQTILDSADDLYTPGWDPIVGHGRINALAAVKALPEPTIEPVAAPTTVTFTDSTSESGQFSDEATFEAALTNATTGSPVQGADLIFEMTGASGSRTFEATTGPDGVAAHSLRLLDEPGAFVLTVRYAGRAGVFEPSADTGTFVIDSEDTTTSTAIDGSSGKRELHVQLADADTTAESLAGRTIEFRVDGTLVDTATTNEAGFAKFEFGSEYRGRREITATFPGDAFYLPSAGSVRT